MTNSDSNDLPVLLWLTDDVADWMHGWGASLVPLHGEAISLHVAVPMGQGVRLAGTVVPFTEVPGASGIDGVVQAPALVSLMERVGPQVAHVDVASGQRRARFAAQVAGVPLLSESRRAGDFVEPPSGGGRIVGRLKARLQQRLRVPDCTVLEFSGPVPESPEWSPMETSCGTNVDPPIAGTRPGFARAPADRFVLLLDARGMDAAAEKVALAHVNRVVARGGGCRLLVIPPSDGPSVWDACRGIVVLPWSLSDDAAILAADAFLAPVDSRFALRTAMRAAALGKAVVAMDTPATRFVVRDGDTGVLVSGRGDAFADAVHALLAQPGQLEWLGEKGRRFARRAFDRDVVVTRLLGLWDRRLSRLTSDGLTVDSSGNLFSEPADERRLRDHTRTVGKGRG
jgi:hypothetical protein